MMIGKGARWQAKLVSRISRHYSRNSAHFEVYNLRTTQNNYE